MNVIRNHVYDIVSLDQFKVLIQREVLALWNFKYHDPDCSMRILPGQDTELDLFKENRNNLCF